MAVEESLTAREAKRRQTRERLLQASIAEFRKNGIADADVDKIVATVGVAQATFFFHFPTKQHVLLELEHREEERMAEQLSRLLTAPHGLADVLREAARLVIGLERRFGAVLFKDILALHFSQTRPVAEDGRDYPMIVLITDEIEQARVRGEIKGDINPMHSAAFFLLGLYAVLTTFYAWPKRKVMLDDYIVQTLRGLGASS
jgi:AcrR family transcriptional regulator